MKAFKKYTYNNFDCYYEYLDTEDDHSILYKERSCDVNFICFTIYLNDEEFNKLNTQEDFEYLVDKKWMELEKVLNK